MASKLSTLINALTGKTTPVDADKIPVLDSENSFNHNWLSFTQLKVYLATLYAPTAKGVTNGDSHDHSGGDGAQIAYSGLSGLPTLGTAAATDSTAYATAAQGSTADSALQPGDVDDAPVNGATTAPISSNWAYDHAAIAVVSNVTGITGADPITNIVSLTQAEYDAIGSPSATTFYVITG